MWATPAGTGRISWLARSGDGFPRARLRAQPWSETDAAPNRWCQPRLLRTRKRRAPCRRRSESRPSTPASSSWLAPPRESVSPRSGQSAPGSASPAASPRPRAPSRRATLHRVARSRCAARTALCSPAAVSPLLLLFRFRPGHQFLQIGRRQPKVAHRIDHFAKRANQCWRVSFLPRGDLTINNPL